VFSLWCISPRSNGGLSFTTVDVGNVLSISGFGMLVFQFIFFPLIANFFGPIMATRIAAVRYGHHAQCNSVLRDNPTTFYINCGSSPNMSHLSFLSCPTYCSFECDLLGGSK
jgi:hypothetical protein